MTQYEDSKRRTLISVVSPCYNEQENIDEFYRRVTEAIADLSDKYDFEIIIIDNKSSDNSREKLYALAKKDASLKVIVNTRNFGHIRSPYYGILQSSGAATIYLASDLQDPPEMIAEFIKHWEDGFKLVMGVKPAADGNQLIHALRRSYYKLLDSISEIDVVIDATGFGLYDREVLSHLRNINDPYPFLRGLVAELGYETKEVIFKQPRRARGISKNNFYTLYDIAWLGLIGHSKVPIRISAFLGFLIGGVSLFFAVIFFVLKLLFWEAFPLGMAPLMIGMFFLFGIQFILLGILGEYVGTILTYVQKRPIVVESERINFDDDQAKEASL